MRNSIYLVKSAHVAFNQFFLSLRDAENYCIRNGIHPESIYAENRISITSDTALQDDGYIYVDAYDAITGVEIGCIIYVLDDAVYFALDTHSINDPDQADILIDVFDGCHHIDADDVADAVADIEKRFFDFICMYR